MVSKDYLLRVLPPFKGNQELLASEQQVTDIIRDMQNSHRLFASDYDLIAGYFDAGNVRVTAKRLFDFCKRNVPYKIESDERQTIRSPAGILARGNGDCKHYASWIAGVLDALRRKGAKIDWCYRFASYSMFNKVPHHVFVVLQVDGGEVWVDPVLPSFNNRKNYWYKTDKKVPMALYRVSGVDDDVSGMDDMGNIFKSAWKGIKKGATKYWGVVKKFAAAPARNAFLGLVALNVHGFASALAKADQNKLRSTWESLGGAYSALRNTFLKGAKKKRIFGVGADDPLPVSVEGVGVIQAAAALALAAPIIAALKGLMKGSSAQTDAAVDNTVNTLNSSVRDTGTPAQIPMPPAATADSTNNVIPFRQIPDGPNLFPSAPAAPVQRPSFLDQAESVLQTADQVVRTVKRNPVINKKAAYVTTAPPPSAEMPPYLKWGLIAGGGFVALKALKVIK